MVQGEEMKHFISIFFLGMILIGSIHMFPGVSGDPNVKRSGEGIVPNPEWGGIPTLEEDSIPIAVLLDGPNSPFINTTDNITTYLIAPKGVSNGAISLNTSIARLSIIGERLSFSLMIEPHKDANGLVSFTLIAVGENSTMNRTAALKISDVNDPPVLSSIDIDDRTHDLAPSGDGSYEVRLDGIEMVYEESYLNFTIVGSPGDRSEDGDRLYYKLDILRSDNWETDPTVNMDTGEVSLHISTEDWIMDNEKLVINIRDGEYSEVLLMIHLEITHINKAPTITLSPGIKERWEQGEVINASFIVSDDDSVGPMEIAFNLDNSLDGSTPSIKDQLPFVSFTRNSNIGINDGSTFWMEINDPFIWKTGAVYLDDIQILVTIRATDPEGDSTILSMMFELVNLNEPPKWNSSLNSNPLQPQTGDRVTFWVDPAEDPDGDELEYVWDFGDGFTGKGRIVEHIFYDSGWKTIQCWASDGNATSEKLYLRTEIVGKSYDRWNDLDNDGDGILNGNDDFPNDRAASKDSDDDRHPDSWNVGYTKLDSTMDLSIDMFPHDREEWIDSDGDGYGDNGDEFPHDMDEWRDSDGDGIGDNGDMFPNTPNDKIKWYVIGGLSVILIIAALSMMIVRNISKAFDGYGDFDEE